MESEDSILSHTFPKQCPEEQSWESAKRRGEEEDGGKREGEVESGWGEQERRGEGRKGQNRRKGREGCGSKQREKGIRNIRKQMLEQILVLFPHTYTYPHEG